MHKYFAEYARLAFETFGDRVKYWITFEDPLTFCSRSFADKNFPPGVNVTGVASYICSYVVLASHATVYHVYEDGFKSTQKGILRDLRVRANNIFTIHLYFPVNILLKLVFDEQFIFFRLR